MSRSIRMFEIIQLLRGAGKALTAQAIGEELEVTKRTIYRDIATLQTTGVPIEGEAGIGYIMRPGYDLPPLMFTAEEVEAIAIGLALIGRTGDKALGDAAQRAGDKINAVLPEDVATDLEEWPIYASDWHEIDASAVAPDLLRKAVRHSEKLRIAYTNAKGETSERTIMPLAIVYYVGSIVVAAWCELRDDFRHFRIDRIVSSTNTGEHFVGQAARLRWQWRTTHEID